MAKKFQIVVDQHEEEGCTELEFNSKKLAEDFRSRFYEGYHFSVVNQDDDCTILIAEPVISTENIKQFVNSVYRTSNVEVL